MMPGRSRRPRWCRQLPPILTLLCLLAGCSAATPQPLAEQPSPTTGRTATSTATTTPTRATPAVTTTPASATPTQPSAASAAPLAITATATLAPPQPLRNTAILDRPLRNLRPLTDGRVKYKLAVWSAGGEWIAATPQDGPGLDVINSATGEVRTVISDTFVLEPIWDAGGAPCLLIHRTSGAQDQLSRACLPQLDAPQPSVVADAPLLAPALLGDQLVYSQAGQLLRQSLTDAEPQPLAQGGALVTAISNADPRTPLLAWSPLVTDLEDVQTLVTPLAQPAPVALSQPGEGLWLPRWSPDGRALVLTSIAGRLISTTVSGDARYDLGPGDLPAWSPDGTRIAYGGANAGTEFISRDIHLVDWQGNGARLRLTDADEEQLFVSPSWSPDGRRIACVEIDSGQIMIGDVP